jgi:CBS domain-containing protein
MKVREIMTRDPACCTRDTRIEEVARMMVERDCGEIPVVASARNPVPVGVITDRDIVTRTVASGRNPIGMMASEVMTTPVVTTTPDASVEDCARMFAVHQVRRVPVVDDQGQCCGIVAQADLALAGPDRVTVEVVREVSQPGNVAEAGRGMASDEDRVV